MNTLNIEDPEQLMKYLRMRGEIGKGELLATKVLAGGVSNRTVFVERAGRTDLVLKQALRKLRVSVEWFSDPSRIHREAEGIRVLNKILSAGTVPAFVFEDFDEGILAMEAVPQPHENWKTLLLEGQIEEMHVAQFGRLLGELHQHFDVSSYASDGVLWQKNFFETLRIEPYYAYAAQQVGESTDFFERLIADARRQENGLTHGDFSPKNILIYRDRLVLLDHEVIHIGDSAFDVGFSMTHLLSKAHHLGAFRGAFLDAAQLYWREYMAVRTIEDHGEFEARAVRHTLGCLLARVAGRSPLEYLSDSEKSWQKRQVVRLMQNPPATIPTLINAFFNA